MNDCPNAEIRDQLCDVVHRTMPEADCKRVEDHIATCADCTAEIELLRRAHALLTRAAPVVDTSAIVAALPRHRARRSPSFGNWRIAASIAVIAVGAASISIARLDQAEPGRGATASGVTTATSAADTHVLSFSGRLSALDDADLEQLLAEIGDLDGVTPAEPGMVIPVPAWDGGTP